MTNNRHHHEGLVGALADLESLADIETSDKVLSEPSSRPPADSAIPPAQVIDDKFANLPASWDQRYVLTDKLGGGMCHVFRARQSSLDGRLVAVKILLDLSKERVARFEQERQTLTHLHAMGCGSIPAPIEFGWYDGWPYLVMEHIQGRTLRQLIAKDDWNPRTADIESIMYQAVRSMNESHRLHVLHRDIKPSNLMLSVDGNLKIIDFGVSNPHFPDKSGLTSSGVVPGTPAFMAPEQLAGKPATVASDLYSLGLVFLQLLDRVRPMHRGPAFGRLVRLSEQMTARDPKKRPESSDQIVQRLRPHEREASVRRTRPFAGLAMIASVVCLFGWCGMNLRSQARLHGTFADIESALGPATEQLAGALAQETTGSDLRALAEKLQQNSHRLRAIRQEQRLDKLRHVAADLSAVARRVAEYSPGICLRWSAVMKEGERLGRDVEIQGTTLEFGAEIPLELGVGITEFRIVHPDGENELLRIDKSTGQWHARGWEAKEPGDYLVHATMYRDNLDKITDIVRILKISPSAGASPIDMDIGKPATVDAPVVIFVNRIATDTAISRIEIHAIDPTGTRRVLSRDYSQQGKDRSIFVPDMAGKWILEAVAHDKHGVAYCPVSNMCLVADLDDPSVFRPY